MKLREVRGNRGKRGLSPVISTVIMTGSIIALLSVALVFANSTLWSTIAQSEFDSGTQFMQTLGLQIDDVAWVTGRTETLRYSSRYGDIVQEPAVLNYSVFIQTTGSSSYELFASYEVDVLLFKIPTASYSRANGYWERFYPSVDDTLTLKGTTAPVARVFAVEKMPMADGSYIRVVVAPAIRARFSSINMSSSSTYYVKLYLPILVEGDTPRRSQSVTLTGQTISATTLNNITSVNVTVSFPRGSPPEGFDDFFFHFPAVSEVIDVPAGYHDAIIELYTGEVKVDVGLTY